MSTQKNTGIVGPGSARAEDVMLPAMKDFIEAGRREIADDRKNCKASVELGGETRELGGNELRRHYLREAYDVKPGEYAAEHGKQRRKLASFRLVPISNMVMANVPWLNAYFFPMPALGPDETPIETTNTNINRKKMGVRFLGPFGGALQHHYVEYLSESPIEMQLLSTDKYIYPTKSLARGDLNFSDKVNGDLARLMELKLGTWAFEMVTAALMSSGLRATFDAENGVKTASLPDANAIDLKAQGAINKAIMKAAWKYAVDCGLVIRNVFVSNQDATDVFDLPWLTDADATTSDTVLPQRVTEEVYMTGGSRINIFGMQANITYLNTLDPNYLWLSFDQAAGNYYQKAALDDTVVDDDYEMRVRWLEGVTQMKAVQLTTPDGMKHRVCRIQFDE